MLRVISMTMLCVLTAACSGGGGAQQTVMGYADTPVATQGLPAESGSTGYSSSSKNTKLAARSDAAPEGSWKRAPAGALADRNYSETTLDTRTALKLINGYRREKGLKPLKLHPKLIRAAKAHSTDLAKWDRISHYGSDGANPWDRVKRAGYQARLAAENVGTGQASFKEVLSGWKESEGHNKNLLLPDAEHMGIALVRRPKTEFKTFWTLVLGSQI